MTTKIFAKDINHLTDARYFAAWGAAWMCYNPEKITLSEIAAIKEWVAGPKHILDTRRIDREEAIAMLSSGIFDGYLTDDGDLYKDIGNILEDMQVFSYNLDHLDHINLIMQINTSTSTASLKKVIYEVEGSTEDVMRFVRENQPYGIIVSGDEEEEIGVKSFDNLDRIFEFLEEL